MRKPRPAGDYGVNFAIALFCCLSAFAPAAAQLKEEFDMGRMQVVFLRDAPGWKAKDEAEARALERQTRVRVARMIEDGHLATGGPASGGGDLRAILVFKTESAEEARRAAESLPAVAAGALRADLVTWYAARNLITKPSPPVAVDGMSDVSRRETADYVFGVLVRGEKWTPAETEETKRLQAGHMANINRLFEAGKLVLAGPFVEGGERRGVFIFKVATLEEAQRLTDTDPAVAAGRLKIEMHRWTVPAGTLR